MTNNSYQKHKERLSKEASERYQNLSEEENDKKAKKVSKKGIKIFLRNKSASYLSI